MQVTSQGLVMLTSQGGESPVAGYSPNRGIVFSALYQFSVAPRQCDRCDMTRIRSDVGHGEIGSLPLGDNPKPHLSTYTHLLLWN